ncbi:MAG: flagellar motor protein [Nitrospirae bacterium]|nr:flagellar motor protein [Nitrospirota bacterium]
MDILTVAGIVLGLSALIGGQFLEGGSVQSLMQFTAAIIVMGGTLGAVMVQFTLPVFIRAMKMGLEAFSSPRDHSLDYIGKIVEYGNVVRKQGILALESKVKEVKDPFLKKGLQLLTDGIQPGQLREILEVESAFREEYHVMSAKVFDAAGGYCPTFGIIGAVMGLIHVMENLADPGKLGAGIAVAFVATIYGVLAANLIFLPLGSKLKLKGRMEGITNELVIEGIISIAGGENPRMIQERLEGFLKESQKKKLKKK